MRPKKLELKITPFTKKVIELIQKIPKGNVATYGQIAKAAGRDGAARQVGWILNSCTKKYKLPWQRVINSQGRISFKRDSQEFADQKRILENEGVKVSHYGEIALATSQAPDSFFRSKKTSRKKILK